MARALGVDVTVGGGEGRASTEPSTGRFGREDGPRAVAGGGAGAARVEGTAPGQGGRPEGGRGQAARPVPSRPAKTGGPGQAWEGRRRSGLRVRLRLLPHPGPWPPPHCHPLTPGSSRDRGARPRAPPASRRPQHVAPRPPPPATRLRRPDWAAGIMCPPPTNHIKGGRSHTCATWSPRRDAPHTRVWPGCPRGEGSAGAREQTRPRWPLGLEERGVGLAPESPFRGRRRPPPVPGP